MEITEEERRTAGGAQTVEQKQKGLHRLKALRTQAARIVKGSKQKQNEKGIVEGSKQFSRSRGAAVLAVSQRCVCPAASALSRHRV